MLDFYDSSVKILEIIVEESIVTYTKIKVSRLLEVMCYFDFVVMLHIMKTVLSKSVVLSKAL